MILCILVLTDICTKIATIQQYISVEVDNAVKCSVGPLNKNGTLTNNPSEMAELLQEQYVSVLSNPAAEKQLPHQDGCNVGPKIGDITFSQADIEAAIDGRQLTPRQLTPRQLPP